MPAPAACLFDLDGLLLDTEPLHARAWREAADHFGTHLTASQLQLLQGRRRNDCADQVLAWILAARQCCPSRDDLLAVRQPIAEALLACAPAMPGAEALVRRCARLAIPMALATSSSCAAVAHKALPHPWLALIQVRVHGDDPGLRAGKPEPDVYRLAAQRLGVDPHACWAFEDSAAGAQAAAAAGCRVHVLRSPATPVTGSAGFPAEAIWLDRLDAVNLGL